MTYLMPVKPESERVHLPGFAAARTSQGKADIVAAALENGTITVESAEKLMNYTRMYQASVIADQHEQRLAALEGKKVPVEDSDVTNEDLV